MQPAPPALQPVFHEAEEKMTKAVDKLRQEFAGLRTGRATASLLDPVRVDCYGSLLPLKQVAAVSNPDGRTLEIKPWDAGTLAAIDKAIRASGLGLTPTNDGKLIRLTIPTLTEERRRDMVKTVKKLAEEFRIAIRNDRRDALDKIKRSEKEKNLPEDQRKAAETSLQALTDAHIRRVDEALAAKEKEILTV